MADDVVEKKSRRRRNRDEENSEVEEEMETERGLTESKGRITPGRRSRGSGKGEGGNFITRSFRSMMTYLRGVQDELDKVVWPTREELIRLTRIVTSVTIASAIVMGAFSWFFTELFRAGLENELVFLGFGVAVVIAYFAIREYLKRERERNDIAPY